MVVALTTDRLGNFTVDLTRTLLYVLLWEVGAPFWQWALVSVFLGLGFTFFSGAVEAWLVDALTAQLAPGGTLVAPVGGPQGQSLLRLRRAADGSIEQADLGPVVFVPLLSGSVDR